ncbi:MAG: 5'/3'-nucleotidase SurE [Polyangiaceae bacterium]
MRPLALLSNDDGFSSIGIRALQKALSTFADVVICAPETEQSAASHALSLNKPLRLREVEAGIFAVDGTPADCVYVAIHSNRVLPRKPDVIVSGVNHGLNLGQDVFYSGTVAAAREGALRGFPALAASAHPKADFDDVARLTAKLAELIMGLKRGDGGGVLFSANFPRTWTSVRSTRLGARAYEELVDFRKDPRGREYLWIGGPTVQHVHAPGTDTEAYDENAISVTPLQLDATDHGYASELGALITSFAIEGKTP